MTPIQSSGTTTETLCSTPFYGSKTLNPNIIEYNSHIHELSLCPT